mmetsp:Transcript_70787/g.207389  ORF Transcript_70787/g.207389 Transcript_70787/m.207389 type:complete len:235 (+) Transcript_70787:106-810(+)
MPSLQGQAGVDHGLEVVPRGRLGLRLHLLALHGLSLGLLHDQPGLFNLRFGGRRGQRIAAVAPPAAARALPELRRPVCRGLLLLGLAENLHVLCVDVLFALHLGKGRVDLPHVGVALLPLRAAVPNLTLWVPLAPATVLFGVALAIVLSTSLAATALTVLLPTPSTSPLAAGPARSRAATHVVASHAPPALLGSVGRRVRYTCVASATSSAGIAVRVGVGPVRVGVCAVGVHAA